MDSHLLKSSSQPRQGRVVLVTGATSGLGKAIAERFASEGNTVIITGRRQDRLEHLKTEWQQKFQINVIPLTFDIRHNNEVETAVQNLLNQVDKVDVLVNNAGLAAGLAPIDEGDIDDWDLMIDTNVKGLLYMTRQIAPLMRAARSGHIFNIGSIAGKSVYQNGNVYCASKFAVDALSQAMRIDLLPFGIKVTAINPGMVETEFSQVRFKGDEVRAKEVYKNIVPLYANDVADAVWYCANLPEHVCINDLTITCTAQANSFYTFRKPEEVGK
jgi:3-hydroxy acid dehydrogenase/malonic semialdehyde reductase